MSNDQTLSAISTAISNTETQLGALDVLTSDVEARQATVEVLTADLESLRVNAAGLDSKARVAKHASTNSALSLAQADLKQAQDKAADQKTKVLIVGKAAAKMLFDVRDSLRIQRTANVTGWLSEQFDWRPVPVVTPAILAAHHESVRSIAELGVTNLSYELAHSDDYSVTALRRLSTHWDELKPLIEAEPNLELSITPAAVLPPVAESKPTPATLSAALVAA